MGSDTLVGQEMLTMLAQPANDEISSTRDRPRSGQPN
jgi:hypothetical protein